MLGEPGRIQISDVVPPLGDGSGRELRIRCMERPHNAQALPLVRQSLELPEQLHMPPRIARMECRIGELTRRKTGKRSSEPRASG